MHWDQLPKKKKKKNSISLVEYYEKEIKTFCHFNSFIMPLNFINLYCGFCHQDIFFFFPLMAIPFSSHPYLSFIWLISLYAQHTFIVAIAFCCAWYCLLVKYIKAERSRIFIRLPLCLCVVVVIVVLLLFLLLLTALYCTACGIVITSSIA